MSSDTPIHSGKSAATPEQQLRLLADNLPALIAYFTVDGLICQFANKAYATAYAFTVDSVVGKSVPDVIGAEAFAAIQPYILRAIEGETVSYERPLVLPDGSARIIEVNLIPQIISGSKPEAAFVLITDITKHRQAEQAIRDSEERVRKFVDAANEGIVFFEKGVITDINDAGARLVRLPIEKIIGRQVLEFVTPDSIEIVADNIRTGFERPYEANILRADGTILTVELVGKVIVRDGKTLRMTIARDISDRKQAEARIQFLAHHDMLTHLPNRAMLLDRLQLMLNVAKRHSTQVGVLFIDLDNFKILNDTRGHDIGDLLLIEVAQRLRTCIRDSDSLARLGGDEFVVLLNELSEDRTQAAVQAKGVGEKILNSINLPYLLDNIEHYSSTSIGISLFADYQQNLDDLLKQADTAMYAAKKSGRNTLRFFDHAMQETLETRSQLEAGMYKALPNDEFRLHYQVQVDSNQRVIGAEALIRWERPEQGIISPELFIPVAEDTGLILPLGQWVLQVACTQLKEWESNPLTDQLSLAVNVSARQFRQPGFVKQVRDVIGQTLINPARLKLELTESTVLENITDIIAKMHALKQIGVRFSMDDFGTGYSSLAYLTQLPLDQLKIDQKFVHNIGSKASDSMIVQTIIGMANNLGIEVIAEGVETDVQRNFLKEAGCMLYQGYLFGSPVPPEEFMASLTPNSIFS